MTVLWVVWGGVAVGIVAFYAWLGWASRKTLSGLLVDSRGRYSLTRFQVSLWTLVVISLVSAVFVARAWTRGVDPLGFTIPSQVLGLLGISLGSAVTAIGIKTSKNRARPQFVAAADPGKGFLAQMLLVEEGPEADKTVDIGKVQNFIITVVLAAAYVILAVHTFAGWGLGNAVTTPAGITTLPTFSGSFLTLLLVSHAGYLVAKAPNRGDDPELDAPTVSYADVALRRTLRRERGEPAPKEARRARLAERRRSALAAARPDPGSDTRAGDPGSGGRGEAGLLERNG